MLSHSLLGNIMKKLITIALLAIAILGLQACGSSKKDSTTESKEPEFTAVHLIQPDDIADYVENFKLQQTRLELQFDNQQSDISLFGLDLEDNVITVKYNQGVATIGFNLEKMEPISSLKLQEGDTTNLPYFAPTRTLQGVDIETSKQGEEFVYSGTLVDSVTQNNYPIRLVINRSLIEGGSSTLVTEGNKATITGTLGTSTYIQIQEMINNSTVDTLVIANVDGSVNDAINMHTGRLIRAAQLTTLLPTDGEAYSGGVDLFAAGVERKYQEGGKLGVHSWCCVDGKTAGELGRDHAAHGAQLTYFREMLGVDKGPEFYFFTLEAAPFDGMHLMTLDEMVQYTLTTQ
jgi:hypothetical protein